MQHASGDMSGTGGLSFEDVSLELSTKPGVSLHYTFNSSSVGEYANTDFLLVCINGLLVPQAGWFPALFELKKRCRALDIPCPSLLTYDRWSQGRTTDADPKDAAADREEGYGHGIMDIVHDLHQLLLQVTDSKHGRHLPSMLFLANSIGCPISRLYAQTYPGTIYAFIFLDSMMANTDFVSLWPDTESPSFDPTESVPPGATVEDLYSAREHYRKLFHPSVRNAENFDRRNLRTLLPHSDAPQLPPVEDTGQMPFVVVVGHDPMTFANEGKERLDIPTELTLRYPHAAWHEYNKGLVKLTNEDNARGPVIAKECGHFVQRDGPGFVAEVVGEVLDALINGRKLKDWD